MYRHGDVNFHRVASVRGRRVPSTTRYVVARGEATGSVHELVAQRPEDFEVWMDGETLYLRVLAPIDLRHTSDHDPLTLAPGSYVQVPEREVDHFARVVRRVVD